LQGFEVVSWQALFAPAGTPKPIVDKLHAEILKIMQTAEMQERIKGLGMQPSSLSTEQVLAFQKAEIDKWAQVIKAANIKLD
jgi:tripartite-type tricarboxylate transporter receptor subunit TctC